jgi:undecaprenyl-diphosphatase
MSPSLLQILILGLIQGAAELLPVSSSAHVIVVEKLLHLDPSSPEMTFLLVMLHTGTMFAVIVYFWKQWRDVYFRSTASFTEFAKYVVLATALTGVVGEAIIKIIEKTLFRGAPHAEIEDLFGRLDLIAPALAAAGILILVAGIFENKKASESMTLTAANDLNMKRVGIIGAVPRIFPFRCDDFGGNAVGCGEIARGNV